MTQKFVSLMSGFKDIGKNGKTKGAIRCQADDLIFDPNDRAAAQVAADAMLATIKENLMQGLAPDGQALPGISASTQDRREVEARQGQRGGDAHPRFKDAAFRAGVAKRYRRDYAAPRGVTETFIPADQHPRGEVSGLLIESMVARGDKSGKGVTVYVAAKRGRPRPAMTTRTPESKSALESVLAGAPIVSPRLMEAPKIRKALGEMLSGLIGKPADLKRNFLKLLKNAKHTGEDLYDLADEVADEGD